MKAFSTFCLIFTLGCLFATVMCDKDEIIFVAAMARHGARTMTYPEYYDIVDNKSFLRNPGRLTNVGKHQLYLLGRQLADTYIRLNKLLSVRYNPKQIIVRSSGLNRTVESAQSILSGLYQPGTGPSINSKQIQHAVPPIKVTNLDDIRMELRDAALPYYTQPVPIHTTTAVKDYLFSPHTECDTIAKDEKQYKDDFEELDDKYSSFFSKLKEKYGLEVHSTFDLYKLYDNVLCALGNAVKLTIDFDLEDLEKFEQITTEENAQVFLRSSLKIKLLSHVLLYDIRKHFMRAVHDSNTGVPVQDRLRMALFEISDAHILALNKLLPLKLNSTVPFAGVLLFELHKITDSRGNMLYKVKAIYNDRVVDLESGGFNRYDKFIQHLKENSYEDEEDFKRNCFSIYGEDYDRETFVAITIILFITLILVWGSSWFLLIRNRNGAKKSEETTEESFVGGIANDPTQMVINEGRATTLGINEDQ